MSLTVVQQYPQEGGGAKTSEVQPNNYVEGNIGLLQICGFDPASSISSVTDNTGSVWAHQSSSDDGAGHGQEVWVCESLVFDGSLSFPTVTIVYGGTDGSGPSYSILYELSGLTTGAAFDVADGFVGNSSDSSGTSCTVTPTDNGEILVLLLDAEASTDTFTATGDETYTLGMTQAADPNCSLWSANAPAAGTATTATITDSAGPSVIYQTLLAMFAPSTPTIVVTLTTPNGFTGVAYTGSATATGGTAPYTYAVTSGSLPPGLSLSSAGVISGTPTAAGTFTFTVTATDAGAFTGSASGSITINDISPNIPTSSGVLAMEAKCLPEGLRLYTVTLDFSSMPGTPLPSSPPFLNYPELTINGNSADGPSHQNSISNYQVVLLKPGNQTQPSARGQGIGLSVIRSLQFYYRSTFGVDGSHNAQGGGDFAFTPEELGLLLVTNTNTNQTVVIPMQPYTGDVNGNPLMNGVFPFFAGPADTIRILKINEGITEPLGYGKVTLQFANFDIAPYVSGSQGTLDTNS